MSKIILIGLVLITSGFSPLLLVLAFLFGFIIDFMRQALRLEDAFFQILGRFSREDINHQTIRGDFLFVSMSKVAQQGLAAEEDLDRLDYYFRFSKADSYWRCRAIKRRFRHFRRGSSDPSNALEKLHHCSSVMPESKIFFVACLYYFCLEAKGSEICLNENFTKLIPQVAGELGMDQSSYSEAIRRAIILARDERPHIDKLGLNSALLANSVGGIPTAKASRFLGERPRDRSIKPTQEVAGEISLICRNNLSRGSHQHQCRLIGHQNAKMPCACPPSDWISSRLRKKEISQPNPKNRT